MENKSFMGTYNGMRLIATNAITKKAQRRTHRKRRINKKWLKRYGYKDVPDDEKIIIYGDCILATPKPVNKLIEEILKKKYISDI